MTWDILIATIPHRHDRLCALLAELERQMQPGVGVLVYRDDLKDQVGVKCQRLVEASQARYVSFIDDDDWVAADYIGRIMAALATEPDYVGFPVTYTVNGNPMIPVDHSLRHDGWHELPGLLVRDISHLNPIRRELSLLGGWLGSGPGLPPGGHGSDAQWASDLRATGLVKTEVYIDEPMYQYRWSTIDNYHTLRVTIGEADRPELPAYDWMTAI